MKATVLQEQFSPQGLAITSMVMEFSISYIHTTQSIETYFRDTNLTLIYTTQHANQFSLLHDK